jgi:hypothetical protein
MKLSSVLFSKGTSHVRSVLSFTSCTNHVPGRVIAGPWMVGSQPIMRVQPPAYFATSTRPASSGDSSPPLNDVRIGAVFIRTTGSGLTRRRRRHR